MSAETDNFRRKFEKGTLGRKTSHGSYWVVEGKTCRVLMKKGEADHIVGIYLGEGISVFHWREFKRRGKGRREEINHVPKINGVLPQNESVLESGFVIPPGPGGSPSGPMLIEIGGKRILLDKERGVDERIITINGYKEDSHWKSSTSPFVFDRVPGNISSIKEAKEYLIPDEIRSRPAQAIAVAGDWYYPAEENANLEVLTPEERAVASTYPSPHFFDLPETWFESAYGSDYGKASYNSLPLRIPDSTKKRIKDSYKEYLERVALHTEAVTNFQFANEKIKEQTKPYKYYLNIEMSVEIESDLTRSVPAQTRITTDNRVYITGKVRSTTFAEWTRCIPNSHRMWKARNYDR